MIHSFYEILKGVGLCSACHKNHCSQIFPKVFSPLAPWFSLIVFLSPKREPVWEGYAWRMCFIRVLP